MQNQLPASEAALAEQLTYGNKEFAALILESELNQNVNNILAVWWCVKRNYF